MLMIEPMAFHLQSPADLISDLDLPILGAHLLAFCDVEGFNIVSGVSLDIIIAMTTLPGHCLVNSLREGNQGTELIHFYCFLHFVFCVLRLFL